MLLDTGVFIRALEHDTAKHAADPRTVDSRDFWMAALRPSSRTTLLIAAPTVLEFRLGPGAPPLPMVDRVEYVAFTASAAEQMASWATGPVIKSVMTATGLTRRLVEYDALIVACAKFGRADLIVSLDDDVHQLSKDAGIDCHLPGDFRALKLTPTGTPSGSAGT
jgi:predicted nucleic acid-binding protein